MTATTNAMIYRRQTTPATDPDLELYASNGDAEAFARLTRRHISLVYTFCRRELADAELAEDAAQAVFILLARKARSMRAGVVLVGWLFDASRYCCANARRAQARRIHHEKEAAKLRPETVTASIPSDHDDEREQMDRMLHQAIASLRARDRRVLLLRYFEQRSNREVAQVLRVTEDAVKHRVVRAVQKLRTLLLREQAVAAESAVSAMSVAAIPQWLESHALLSAPATLAHTAAQAALGAGGSSTTAVLIANAASSAAMWFKTTIALATVTMALAVAVGSVALIGQIQSAGNPAAAPPAPTTQAAAPSTAPTPQSVVARFVDRSTPLACLRSISGAIKALDEDAVARCVVYADSDEGRAFKSGLRMAIAQVRVERAMHDRFGPEVRTVRFTDTTPELIDSTVDTVTPGDVQVSGDRATVTLRPSAEVLAKSGLPAAIAFIGIPFQLVRDADATGGWRFDPAATFVLVAIDPRKGPSRGDPKQFIAFFDAISSAANDLVTAIESGKLDDPRSAQAFFNNSLASNPTKPAASTLSQATLIPKSLAGMLEQK